MEIYSKSKIWFVTGAQLLYGGETVRQVNEHSETMIAGLNQGGLPLEIVYRGTVNSAEEVTRLFREAENSDECAGIITWMHTFSPAKMWIRGLQAFRKPLLHLHTQFQREIPWDSIDMDYMNLNQSAHGDREFAHIVSRLRKNRRIVVGFWEDETVRSQISDWMRVCAGWKDQQTLRIVRFGDNMNNVAVTDGDKVEAEIRLGYHVDYCPIGDLAEMQDSVSDAQIAALLDEYETLYEVSGELRNDENAWRQVREAAREELALRMMLKEKNANAFTTNFDALHGLDQLPGLASQRLMAEGIGFGAEGDWKTAALTRLFSVMGAGLKGGSSFMEDYVLHFRGGGAILQAHMLEVSPAISGEKPRLEVHPLGIGGKNPPARLVFTAHSGKGIAATVVDLGNRFRMIAAKVDCLQPEADLPKLPVARAFWKPEPDLAVGAAAWMLAGGTHHSAFTFDLTLDQLEDYAEMAEMELLVIDETTTLSRFKETLRLNEIFYGFGRNF
ncbi:MAG: L-arabinose isomerase [Planctomycetaceae bacterium]|nr:L-arabinose isomerase [Planctomycetaceae bacterium]MBP3693483.1 L-arabinose isomerase [Thermoguttaceae bacterium]